MIPFKQSQPLALHRTVFFTAVQSANLQTRMTGLSGFTVKLKKPGVASASATNAPAQVDSVNHPGVYSLLLTASEVDTAGFGILEITASSMEPREIPFFVEPAIFATASTGTLTPSSFTTDRTEATTDYWKDALIRAVDGANVGQVKKIGGYNGVTQVIALALINGAQQAFTSAPSNGDHFEIITR